MAVTRTRAMGCGLAIAVALAFGIVVVALRGPSPPAGGPPAAATDAVGSGAPAETQPSRVRRRVRRAGEVSAPDAGGQAEPAPAEPAPEEHPPAVVVVAPATDSSDRSEAGLAVLERYLDMGADVSGVMSNYDTMRARIRTTAGPLRRIESEGERTAVDLTEVASDAAVLEFGEGVFVLDRGLKGLNVRRDDVESLEIRGAGMDRTKLIGPGWAFLCASEKSHVRNLVIRDLTIDSVEKGQIVLDARGGIAASLERVRLDGWEVAGHAAPFGVTGTAFLAFRECEFLGPGDGWVLSLRGPALVLFERWHFADARGALIANAGSWRPAVVNMNHCTFTNVRLSDREVDTGRTGGARVSIRGGSAALGPSAWTEDKRREHFRVADAALVEGFSITRARPFFTANDAARALELASSSAYRVFALEVHTRARGVAVELDFYGFEAESGDTPVRRTRLYDGGTLAELPQAPRRVGRLHGEITREDALRTMDLSELVRRADLEVDDNVLQVSLYPVGAPGSHPLVAIGLEGGQVVLDAVTGEELSRR